MGASRIPVSLQPRLPPLPGRPIPSPRTCIRLPTAAAASEAARPSVPPSPARCTAAAGRADFFALCLTGSPFGCVAVDSRPHHLPLPSLSLYEEGGVQEVEIRKLGPIFFPLQSARVKFMWSPGCSQSEDHQVMEMPAGISDVALPPCSPRLLF